MRRERTLGASFSQVEVIFFTVHLAERCLPLLAERIERVRVAFRDARGQPPFTVAALEVMPDHRQAIGSLPERDTDSGWRRLLKTPFPRPRPRGERRAVRHLAKAERGIEQRRSWEPTLRNERDFARPVDYSHCKPANPGQAKRVRD